MEIGISERINYENNPEIIHNKETASAVSFKTVLNNIDSVNSEVNNANDNNNLLGYVDNKTPALCGIDESKVNNDDDADYDKDEEDENRIHSCYECEVREDCLRFQEDKDDILMDNKISLKTRYDPISRKNIPSFTDFITEDNIHSTMSVLYAAYLMLGQKRKK